jgi:hypothetical protein
MEGILTTFLGHPERKKLRIIRLIQTHQYLVNQLRFPLTPSLSPEGKGEGGGVKNV